MPIYEMAYDLTGKVIGHLTVIKYLNKGRWLCQCDCTPNKFKVARSDRLRSGMTISCGCIEKNAHLIKKWDFIEIDADTYGVPLTRGQVALIDKKDSEIVKNHTWSALYSKKRNVFYAMSHEGPMHKILMCSPKGMDVDHKDRNTLNNRRSNLRICSRTQNNMNRPKQRNNRSGYKGVIENSCGNFYAKIAANKIVTYLGTFKTPEEASQAYIDAAKEIQGEFYPTSE